MTGVLWWGVTAVQEFYSQVPASYRKCIRELEWGDQTCETVGHWKAFVGTEDSPESIANACVHLRTPEGGGANDDQGRVLAPGFDLL